MKLRFSVVVRGIFILFSVCFFFAACDRVLDAEKSDDTKFELGELTLSSTSMVLFVDGGEKAISVEMAENTAEVFTVDWVSDNPETAEVTWDGETAVVYPKSQGNATITAKLKPKNEAFKPDFELPEASCPITVLTEFKLDNQRLLFFNGESSQTLTALLPQAVFEVAEIKWSVETSQNNSITVSGTGASATVAAEKLEMFGIITARLEAKDAAAFNGTGRTAVCAATVLESPSIEAAPAAYMLGPSPPVLKRALYTAQYGPGRIDIYNPTVNWTSSNPNKLDFEGEGSVGLGRATTYVIAKEAGAVELTVKLTVAERDFLKTTQIVINQYEAPAIAVTSVKMSKKPATLIKTDMTELITVTAAADSGTPSDPYIEWGISELGVVEFIDDESSANNSGKYLRGVWQGEGAKQVTVTAKSRSNPDVLDFFNILVSPLVVTVSPVAGSSTSFISGQTITLQAVVHTADNRNVLEWTTNHAEWLTLTPGGSHNDTVQVSMKADASVTGPSSVEISASAAADYGVSSGTLVVTINPHSFSVIYNKNDGSLPAVTQTAGPFVYGDGTVNLASLETIGWTWEGRTFKGWADSADGNVAYRNEAPLTAFNSHAQAQTPDGTVTLYAKWRINDPALEEINNDDFGPNAEVTELNVFNDWYLGPDNKPIFITLPEGQIKWTEAVEAVKNGPAGNYIINMNEYFRMSPPLVLTGSHGSEKKTVSIRRSPTAPTTLSVLASGAKIFNISGNNHLIFRGFRIDTAGSPSSTDPVITVGNGAVLEFKKDAVITKMEMSAISLENGGKFIMRDNASIKESDISGYRRGVVQVKTGSVFEMYDTATLTNNKNFATLWSPGGGYSAVDLYACSVLLEGGTFTMYDSSSIIDSSIQATNFIGDAADARFFGAGVFLSSGTFIMNDNSIIAGSSASLNSGANPNVLYGGGLYFEAPYTNSVFIKKGGTIYGSEAGVPENLRNKAGNGAALYVDGTYKRDTTITPAQALRFENGVWVNWTGD
ncbi:MAG: InlB B-repeat-containing protein [Spirochaetaceae bacterium]|jgi:hypothetical protein|nr:InlB B-repeat-containing protein [Spirochaetaceae bacterium]